MLNIKTGDSLELQLEGDKIVIKPIAGLPAGNSVKNNILIFPLEEKPAEPAIKFPLRKLSGEINKVG